MDDVTSDDFWRDYQNASEAHKRAMSLRVDAERELARSFSREALEKWNAALRDENVCYEQLGSAAQVVWVKYKDC